MTHALDETHDPSRSSWVEGADGHADFPVQNLPYGMFSPQEGDRRAGVAIGERILDLRAVAATGLLPPAGAEVLGDATLNRLMALLAAERTDLRRRLSALLSEPAHREDLEPLLHSARDCVLHLPAAIGDYTDFYVGIHHANNVGRQFRPDNPLLPNYKHVPIGYHGRASSVRPSGVPVVRP
ncbi:MAG: fumarylacetoacetase, partial [Phenylobacterium sp.]|nr:fumarylacetoacetase [Phenylobacterium sp.]